MTSSDPFDSRLLLTEDEKKVFSLRLYERISALYFSDEYTARRFIPELEEFDFRISISSSEGEQTLVDVWVNTKQYQAAMKERNQQRKRIKQIAKVSSLSKDIGWALLYTFMWVIFSGALAWVFSLIIPSLQNYTFTVALTVGGITLLINAVWLIYKHFIRH